MERRPANPLKDLALSEIPSRDDFQRAQTDPAMINPEKPDFYLLTEPAATAIADARIFAASTSAALQEAYIADPNGKAAASAQRFLVITQCTTIQTAASPQSDDQAAGEAG